MELKAVLLIAVAMLGMCYALLGSLKLALAERLGIAEDKMGGLVAAFGFMVGPVILLSGFLTDALGRKGVWLAGAGLIILSLLLLARTKRYVGAVVAVLLLGSGWAAMINVSNVVMEQAYDNLFVGANFVDFVFGLGAFLTPAGVALLLRRLKFSLGISLLGAVVVVPLVCILLFYDDPPAAAQTVDTGQFAAMLRDPVLWLCCASMLFYAPLELSVGAWATTLVKDQSPADASPEKAEAVATAALSGFWLCFMGSRLAASLVALLLVVKGFEHALHIVLAVLGTGALVGLVLARSRGLVIGLVLFCGLVFGPVFPTLIAILLNHFNDEVAGRAVGIFFACASIGWTLIPPLIGRVAKRTNLQRGFLVAVASSVIFLGLVIAHYIVHAR